MSSNYYLCHYNSNCNVHLIHQLNNCINLCGAFLKESQMLENTCGSCKCGTDINILNKLQYIIQFQADMQQRFEKSAKETDPELKHEYNCECIDCGNKFGSLPLLVEVIEAQTESNTNKSESDAQMPSTSANSNEAIKKQMKCTICDKIYSHKGDFNKHLRTHSGEQPYSCNICKRKFSHTSNLKRHLIVHSGIKSYVCENCGKSFSRKDKLELHKTTKICKKRSKKA